ATAVPAPIRLPPSYTPRGTTPRNSTSVSASTRRSRNSGTRSVPPASATEPLPSAAVAVSSDSGWSSFKLLPLPGLGQRSQHLIPGHGQRADVGAGRVPDRVHDRGRGRHDRRLAEPLRAEVRQMLVRNVEQFDDDLRAV